MKRWDWVQRIAIGIGVLSILLPLMCWKHIPDQLPAHYNAMGIVDRWSDKNSLILIFFCIAFLMGGMSIAAYVLKTNTISKFSTDKDRSKSAVAYAVLVAMNLVVQLMFAYIVFCVTTCRTLGSWFFPVTMIAVFAPILVLVFLIKKRFAKYPKETRKPDIVFHTKIDLWLGILLGAVLVFICYLLIIDFSLGNLLIQLGTFIIVIPLFFVKYECYPEYLLVDCSIYGKERIYYANIKKIKKTSNPISSAALSLKRIEIRYVDKITGGNEMVLISPKDRDAFIRLIEIYKSEMK